MPGAMPRVPDLYDPMRDVSATFHVSELAADNPGAHSPFGDVQFPLPLERLNYQHPTRAERPRLAGD